MAFEWTADILEVTEEFAASQSKSVQIFLTLPTRVFKLSLEKDLFTGSQLLCLCPSITLVSLSQSLRHSFHTAFFMNNICHIASLSLKVTLVNYWWGQMITGLTSVCSRLPVVSVFMFTLFLLVFMKTLIWWITVCSYCWGSVGAFTETWNVKLQMQPWTSRLLLCFNEICKR